MIVSHKHKFIFLEVPKTGSASIKGALLRALKDIKKLGEDKVDIWKDDWMCNDNRETKISTAKDSKTVYKHMPARKLKDVLGDKLWDEYFTFAFVRNPWDHRVSAYFFLNKLNDKGDVENQRITSYFKMMIDDAVKLDINKWVMKYPGSLPNHLIEGKDKLLVDFVGKFENLENDFKKICNIIGFPKTELAHSNKTEHDHYSSYYKNRAKKRIAKIYKHYLDKFDYAFDASKT